MRVTRWIFVGAAIAAVVWWRWHGTSARTDTNIELSRSVVRDVASLSGGGIRWHVSAMPNESGTQSAVNVYNVQLVAAQVEGDIITYVDTPSWTIALDLGRIHEIVCVERFIHHPPPGFWMRSLSFRKGPDDEDGFPDEMLEIFFIEDRHAEFDRICDKHGLRRDR